MKFSKFIISGLAIILMLLAENTFTLAHEEELEFFHPVKITKDKSITIMDCVSSAYQNSPKIKRQKYHLDLA